MTTSSAEDRQLLAQMVREAAAGGPRAQLGDGEPASTDERLWKTLTQQIGLTGLLVPESLGGSEGRMADVAAAIVELGAALAPVPSLSTVGMATPLLRLAVAHSGDAAELLAHVAEGRRMAVAWPQPASTDLTPVVQLSSDATLRGEARFVLDGADAETVLVVGEGPHGCTLTVVDTHSERVHHASLPTLDLTRGIATFRFDDAPATILAEGDAAAAICASGLDLALVSIAAEQVGIAARSLDEAVAWAKQRVQFDRIIGSFQAIKHQIVDLLMETELARSSLDVAVEAADAYLSRPSETTGRELRTASSAAKAVCGDAAARVADQALHILGGIGFTWEHDAHLRFRRAKTLEVLLGSPAAHRERLAASMGVGVGITQARDHQELT